MNSYGIPTFKHLGLLVRVLGETTITTRVARILDYIKEKIKIQLPLVNLQGIKLTVGWSIV